MNLRFQKLILLYHSEVNQSKKSNNTGGNFIMADKTLVCKDCGQEFTFTQGEQDFYKEKGFENEPVRCPECRKSRKQQRRSFDR